MSKNGKPQVVNTGVDPRSQGYIDKLRSYGQGAAATAAGGPAGGGSWFTGALTPDQINAAMSPYLSNVVDATRGEFDYLRSKSANDVQSQATMAGAYGGSRHGVAEAVRAGELDRAQTGQIANLMQGGYQQALALAEHQRQLREQQLQEPLWRQQQALQMMNLGMGPVGTQVSQPTQKNILGSVAGGAAAGSTFGVPGAIIGGGLGLLGGLF